jgi:hypothetical protein
MHAALHTDSAKRGIKSPFLRGRLLRSRVYSSGNVSYTLYNKSRYHFKYTSPEIIGGNSHNFGTNVTLNLESGQLHKLDEYGDRKG